MADKNNLIVYCEYEDGKVADVSLELLTKGRQLANKLGIKLEAVVAGDNLKDIEKQILPYGVDHSLQIGGSSSLSIYLASPFIDPHQPFQGD